MNILSSRINALRKISHIAGFKTRKMIAEGIIISNIIYVIAVYGSCCEYLKTGLQIVQNTAARCVTGLGWRTPIRVLFMQCGWLSVRQMSMYHSLVLVHKVRQEGKPCYLADKLSTSFNYRSRLASTNGIRKNEKIDSDMRKDSYLPRTSNEWNNLPAHLRNQTELKKFKTEPRSWIITNVNTM